MCLEVPTLNRRTAAPRAYVIRPILTTEKEYAIIWDADERYTSCH